MTKSPICKVVEVMPKAPVNVAPAAEGFRLLVESWLEYKKISEAEETKREAIRGQRDVAIARINAQKEVFQNVINNSFAERARNFEKLFEALDKGIAEQNDQVINGAMQLIVGQMQTSPLAGMKDLMTAIANPDVKSIEI